MGAGRNWSQEPEEHPDLLRWYAHKFISPLLMFPSHYRLHSSNLGSAANKWFRKKGTESKAAPRNSWLSQLTPSSGGLHAAVFRRQAPLYAIYVQHRGTDVTNLYWDQPRTGSVQFRVRFSYHWCSPKMGESVLIFVISTSFDQLLPICVGIPLRRNLGYFSIPEFLN